MGEWSLSDKVMNELVLKIKRFKREEKMNIKFTWIGKDMEEQLIAH